MNLEPKQARSVFGPNNLDLDAPTAGDLVDEADRRRLAGDPAIAVWKGGLGPIFGALHCGACSQRVEDDQQLIAFKCEGCGEWNTVPVYMNAQHGGQLEIIPAERRNEYPSLRKASSILPKAE